MRKTTLSIGSKDFDVTLDEDFAAFFEARFAEDFGDKRTIETKDLLWAYIQKIHDDYTNGKQYKELMEKIDKL